MHENGREKLKSLDFFAQMQIHWPSILLISIFFNPAVQTFMKNLEANFQMFRGQFDLRLKGQLFTIWPQVSKRGSHVPIEP